MAFRPEPKKWIPNWANEFIISDKEIELLKEVFGEEEQQNGAINLLRDLLCGFPLTNEQKLLAKGLFGREEVKNLITKRLYPVLDKSNPVGQATDVWINVQVEGMSKETIAQIILSRHRFLEMIKQSLLLLENPDGEPVDLSYEPSNNVSFDDYGIRLMARNMFITYISGQLSSMRIIAGSKKETLQETRERMSRNSSK